MISKIIGSYLMFLPFTILASYFLGPFGGVWYFIGWSMGALYVFFRYRKKPLPPALKPYWNLAQLVFVSSVSCIYSSRHISGVEAVMWFGLLFPFLQLIVIGFVHPHEAEGPDKKTHIQYSDKVIFAGYGAVFVIFLGLVSLSHIRAANEKRLAAAEVEAQSQKTFAGFKTSKQLAEIADNFKCNDEGDNGSYVSRVLSEPNLADHKAGMELRVKKEMQRIFNADVWVEKQDRKLSNLDGCLKMLSKYISAKSQNPEFFTDVLKLESSVREGLNFDAKIQKLRSEFYSSWSDTRRLSEELDKVKWIRGYMVGELAPNQYEVDIFGKRIVLKTKGTTFQSKGLFFMNVVKTGSIDTKLSERAGGFSATIDVYEEVLDYEKNKALVAKYKRESKEFSEEMSASVQNNWKEKVFPHAQEFFGKWLDNLTDRSLTSE